MNTKICKNCKFSIGTKCRNQEIIGEYGTGRYITYYLYECAYNPKWCDVDENHHCSHWSSKSNNKQD